MYDLIKKEFARLVAEKGLEAEEVIIRALPLSPQEAIGNPEDRDYPLITGRERMMQAHFRGSPGQAFTDMYGNFSGRLADILEMELSSNFRRAVFISSLNAVLRHLGLIDKSQHCRDDEPRECSREVAALIERNYGHPRVAMAGFQPRMVAALAPIFELRVTDMDEENTGSEKSGIVIHGPEKTADFLNWCDIALVTGSTIVNNTIEQFQMAKPVIFYGITISGVARLLGLNHFCHRGH